MVRKAYGRRAFPRLLIAAIVPIADSVWAPDSISTMTTSEPLTEAARRRTGMTASAVLTFVVASALD